MPSTFLSSLKSLLTLSRGLKLVFGFVFTQLVFILFLDSVNL